MRLTATIYITTQSNEHIYKTQISMCNKQSLFISYHSNS